MPRGVIILPIVLALVACSHEPIGYISPTDRNLLPAQARLGGSGGPPGQPVSVNEMLARARGAKDAPAHTGRLMLQFNGDTVTLDDAQRKSLDDFATAAGARPVKVSARKGGFSDSDARLASRRALAVAHALTARLPDVDVRFIPALPADVVVVGFAARLETIKGVDVAIRALA